MPVPFMMMVVVGKTGSLEVIPKDDCLKPPVAGIKATLVVHEHGWIRADPAFFRMQSLDAITPGNAEFR